MTHNEKTAAYLAKNEDDDLLLSHTDDLLTRAESGSVVVSSFLNLGEQYLIRAYLSAAGKTEGADYCFFGGYPFAERKKLYLFPGYIADLVRDFKSDDDLLLPYCMEEEAVVAIKVSGSGYKTLGHRDYLGSLLSLGVERPVIGDIAVTDDHHAVIFTDAKMSEYFLSNLERIGNDKVGCAVLSPHDTQTLPDTRRYEILSDTVASLRLDGIVAAVCGLSREKAKQAVSSGFVEVDFRETVSPDAELSPGMYLSVRGFGRFIFESVDGTSKKGRLRIRLKKFV